MKQTKPLKKNNSALLFQSSQQSQLGLGLKEGRNEGSKLIIHRLCKNVTLLELFELNVMF